MPEAIDKKLIASTFRKYFRHLANREHSKAMDYIYPPLFKIIPRKALLSTMKQGDKSVSIKLTGLSLEKISSAKSKGSVDYVVLDYRYTLTMTFPEPEPDEDGDTYEQLKEKEHQLDFTYEILKSKYGKKNITIDLEKLQLITNVKSQVYCISDRGLKGWKFLEKKKGTEALLKKLLG